MEEEFVDQFEVQEVEAELTNRLEMVQNQLEEISPEALAWMVKKEAEEQDEDPWTKGERLMEDWIKQGWINHGSWSSASAWQGTSSWRTSWPGSWTTREKRPLVLHPGYATETGQTGWYETEDAEWEWWSKWQPRSSTASTASASSSTAWAGKDWAAAEYGQSNFHMQLKEEQHHAGAKRARRELPPVPEFDGDL